MFCFCLFCRFFCLFCRFCRFKCFVFVFFVVFFVFFVVFVFFVGSVECWRCFEGVLSSDAILKDCMTSQPSFSQVLLTYTRVEPTKFQLGPTDQSFDQVFLNGTLTRTMDTGSIVCSARSYCQKHKPHMQGLLDQS